MEALANLDSGICRALLKNSKSRCNPRGNLQTNKCSPRRAQNDFRNRESKSFTVYEVQFERAQSWKLEL